ncbi:unnamed protein product [Rotaria sp. Silwood1]|nr:unnamed protein product [Rotaria sp. Silwood1]
MCVCPLCFYGTRCQFSSSLFGLSFNAILGYHIEVNVNMKNQSHIVQISLVLTIIMIIIGLINGILSMITFKNKATHQVGCGFYLLGSSITTLLIVITFAMKFSILIIIQMTYNTNRSFLYIQCLSIDFFLRFFLNMDKWLNACVAAERAFATIKGANFNEKKSKQVAKYIILTLIFLTIRTTIYDPIHRRLLDDDDDDDSDKKRIWCIVTYSSNFRIFNSIVNIFHFCVPFLIDILSAIIIIIKTTRQRTTVQTHQTYGKLLREQIQQHSHLLVAPILLVIIALPHLIISFISGCMKSINDSWLFLIGYFISLIPPMLTFLVFVLPSKLYKTEFQKSIHQYQRRIQTRLHFIS